MLNLIFFFFTKSYNYFLDYILNIILFSKISNNEKIKNKK
jgi:hypothetical protein